MTTATDTLARLCYVEGCWAYFTTKSVEEQWGDDWNDVPYEHNAGSPYEYGEWDKEHGKEPWSVFKVAFEGPFERPSDWHTNSPYSVEEINAGATPWLKTDRYAYKDTPKVAIPAGVTLADFIDLVHAGQGTVYLPLT